MNAGVVDRYTFSISITVTTMDVPFFTGTGDEDPEDPATLGFARFALQQMITAIDERLNKPDEGKDREEEPITP